MNILKEFPETLVKIIDKFLDKNKSVDRKVFLKILEFVYKEGSIKGQNKYLTTKKDANEE